MPPRKKKGRLIHEYFSANHEKVGVALLSRLRFDEFYGALG